MVTSPARQSDIFVEASRLETQLQSRRLRPASAVPVFEREVFGSLPVVIITSYAFRSGLGRSTGYPIVSLEPYASVVTMQLARRCGAMAFYPKGPAQVSDEMTFKGCVLKTDNLLYLSAYKFMLVLQEGVRNVVVVNTYRGRSNQGFPALVNWIHQALRSADLTYYDKQEWCIEVKDDIAPWVRRIHNVPSILLELPGSVLRGSETYPRFIDALARILPQICQECSRVCLAPFVEPCMKIGDIKRRIQEEQRANRSLAAPDFRGESFFDLDLREITGLRRARFDGASFANCDLSGTDLRKASFQDAALKKVNLSGANLKKADLSDTTIQKSNLAQANLTKANLQYAYLDKVDLTGAILQEANFRLRGLENVQASGADFTNAQLRKKHQRLLIQMGAVGTEAIDTDEAQEAQAEPKDAPPDPIDLTEKRMMDMFDTILGGSASPDDKETN